MMWADMTGWLSANSGNIKTTAISLAVCACCIGGYLLMDRIKKDGNEEFIVMKRNAKGQFQRADKNAYTFEKPNPAEQIAEKKQQEAAASSTKFPSVEESNSAEPEVKPEREIRKSPLQSAGMPEREIRRSPLQSDSKSENKSEIRTEKETVNNPVFIPTPVFMNNGANGFNGRNGRNGFNGINGQQEPAKDSEGQPEREIRRSASSEARDNYSSMNSYASIQNNPSSPRESENYKFNDRRDEEIYDRLERLEKLQRHPSSMYEPMGYSSRVPSAADYVSSPRGCSRCSIMTNADRIRSMTDEELAEFLADVERGGLKPVRFLRLWLKQEERK